MSYDVDEKSEHEDAVAFFNRGKKNTTIRAVKNVWYERACAHVRHYKRFYIAFSIILVLAVTATALAPSMIQMHRQRGQGGIGGGAKALPSSSTLAPIVTTPILTVSMSSSSSLSLSSTSTTTAAGATTTTEATIATTMSNVASTPSPSPSATCAASSFTANASFVGVYDPAVNPPQFTIVAARSPADCCRRCFSFAQQFSSVLTPSRRCNGWGFINSLCSVVYDYPGDGANGTCPKGYPSVQISSGQGGDKDFAGRGPCALVANG